MKNSLILIFVICVQTLYSQKVVLKGNAKTVDNIGFVRIVLNNTLRKTPKNLPNSMFKNKRLTFSSNQDGRFSINVNLKDSLVFSKYNYISQTHKVSDLISQQDSINVILEKEPCVEYIPCKESNPELYVFIGEKIDVSYAKKTRYCNTLSLDSKYKSKYKILRKFTNNLNSKTINFTSYDHNSMIKYDEFKNVLLFVRKYCDRLIHEKYKFHPVYKMKNGKWAAPIFKEYSMGKRISNKQPHKVEMAEPITIPRVKSHLKLEDIYKKPYYKIVKGKVYMLYGYYPEDLITN